LLYLLGVLKSLADKNRFGATATTTARFNSAGTPPTKKSRIRRKLLFLLSIVLSSFYIRQLVTGQSLLANPGLPS
jgi:hypothetical protein